MKRFLFVLLVMCSIPALSQAKPRRISIDQFGYGLYYAPVSTPAKNFIVLLSSSTGWDDAADAMAAQFAQEGNAVFGLDVKTYYASRALSDDECLYPSGLIEDKIQTLQESFRAAAYLRPVLIGLGDSGAFAAATMLQTLPGTYQSVIAPHFCPVIPAPKPLCLGTRLSRKASFYHPKDNTVLAEEQIILAMDSHCDSDQQGWAAVESMGHDADFIRAALAPKALGQSRSLVVLEDLPLTYLPGAADNDWLILFVSGDAGWRDIDRQIAEKLQSDGYSIIGLDSLRYFWKKKSPLQTAADLDRILTMAAASWNKAKIALAGYSFGADILPFTIPYMKSRDRVQSLILIGFGIDASFEISISGFLGHGDSRYNTVAAFAQMPPIPALCIYGQEEAENHETGCPLLPQDWVEKALFSGGHHYNRNYDALARRIDQVLRMRAAP